MNKNAEKIGGGNAKGAEKMLFTFQPSVRPAVCLSLAAHVAVNVHLIAPDGTHAAIDIVSAWEKISISKISKGKTFHTYTTFSK